MNVLYARGTGHSRSERLAGIDDLEPVADAQGDVPGQALVKEVSGWRGRVGAVTKMNRGGTWAMQWLWQLTSAGASENRTCSPLMQRVSCAAGARLGTNLISCNISAFEGNPKVVKSKVLRCMGHWSPRQLLEYLVEGS